MREPGDNKKFSSIWSRLMPYIMWLLPVLVVNLGLSFLAEIELAWKERGQDETAQHELEALSRSSSVESRLNRMGGLVVEQIEASVKSNSGDKELERQLEQFGQVTFSPVFPKYKLHVFRKTQAAAAFELFHAQSGKVESKRAMAIIFNYLVDQHKGKVLSAENKKQRDKISENYFGRTLRTEAFANSQKGRTSYILHDNLPHWFIWDYHENSGHNAWGYLLTAVINDDSRATARRMAIDDCRQRGNGLAGFLPVVSENAAAVVSPELEKSKIFQSWRRSEVRRLDENCANWLRNGPPPPALLGNFKIYSHLGADSDYLTLFLARRPVQAPMPFWLMFLNFFTGSIWVLLVLRGLILNRWLEARLTMRFLILYFLATTFPLGLLGTTYAAYQYQTGRSAQNQIADKLEGCLRQIESAKMQFQEEYQKAARSLFSDKQLAGLISSEGLSGEKAKARILSCFSDRENPLPLLGFFLLDAAGQGTEFACQGTSPRRLKDIFSVFRAPIIDNLRNHLVKAEPGVQLPEFKVSDEEKFGAQAFGSLSDNNFTEEIEKRRNYCISQQSGEVTATLIFDYLKIGDLPAALLFLVWDSGQLFEKSIGVSIRSLKASYPEFSFIAFRNSPQGLRILYRSEDDELSRQWFSEAVGVAETAAGRGGTVKQHLPGLSVVALPFGRDSGIVISGLADHQKIKTDEAHRQRVFLLLIVFSLVTAAICAWFTAAFLLKPITDLKLALDRVSDGDYSGNLDSSRPDELGKLTREFAQMVEGLKERKRLSSLLSDHAVEALSRNSSARAEDDSRAFDGIALVSDIRGFTTLCETYQTDEITEMLNHHFAAMAEAIAANGGRIYKFIGDAVEAVFDADEIATAAANAVTAAVRMHVALREINLKRQEKGLFTYAFGVGLARGKFYAGSVGSENTRLDYSIIGEHFHRAAQLEAMTKNCSGMPVVFDDEVAGLLGNAIKTVEVNGNPAALTFAADDEWKAAIVAEYTETAVSRAAEKGRPSQVQAESISNSANEGSFKLTTVILSAIFVILTGFGILKGLAWQNQLQDNLTRHQAGEQMFILARQIMSEKSPTVALETIVKAGEMEIEKQLRFAKQPGENALFKRTMERTMAELRRLGISPSRVLVTTYGAGNESIPEVALAYGLSEQHKNWFLQLSQLESHLRNGVETFPLRKHLDAGIKEVFGTSIPTGNIIDENIGRAALVSNGEIVEYLYWNLIRAFPDEFRRSPLPEKNWELANFNRGQRIAGAVFFAVPASEVNGNFDLLVNAYSSADCKIAIRDESGREYRSPDFPVLSAGDKAGDTEFLVRTEKVAMNNQQCNLSIARKVSESGRTKYFTYDAVIAFIVLLFIYFVVKTARMESILSRSIQVKLIFSILLTAVVPILTVIFVADSFVFENHQALVRHQRTELQRYLDSFELRQSWYKQVIAKQIVNLTATPRVLSLAQELESDPGKREPADSLRSIFAEAFVRVNKDDDWASNATCRDVILVGRQNWEVAYSKKATGPGDFASILGQMGKQILGKISTSQQTPDLKMQNVKGELMIEAAMRSIRSNFGDEAYIKLNAIFSKLVEFEITSGSALMMVLPLPSISDPQHLAIWMVSINGGGYLIRIATHNRGPFAVFTLPDFYSGSIRDMFSAFPGLNLEKAAAWTNSANMPVSFVYKVGNENVSIEGRPGISQINNFFVGAASQSPIDRASRRIRQSLAYFLLLAIALFLIIGHQTASDIMVPVGALSEGMHQIGQQNLFYRINLDRNDELGQLCASYDRFARGMAEKEIMGKMLSRSARQAAGAGQMVSSRRKFVFIFIGSPDFAAQLSLGNTSMLFKKLREQVTMVCRIILEEGGDIDKLMGDKVLGVFPVSEGNETAARLAAIKAAARIIAAENAEQLHFPLAMGLNAGEVICGMLGFGAKRDFTVIGDAVNVSARIQKEAEKMKTSRCLFSEGFVKGSSERDSFVLHAETSLKGKAEKMRLYRRVG